MTSKTPIKGYRSLSDEELQAINVLKGLEANILHLLDSASESLGIEVNPRWLAIGRTHIEQGFMAINRAIAKPLPIPPSGDVTD